MGSMTQEQINLDLFDEVKRLRQENAKYIAILTEIESGYRGSGQDLDEALDKYFQSPIMFTDKAPGEDFE